MKRSAKPAKGAAPKDSAGVSPVFRVNNGTYGILTVIQKTVLIALLHRCYLQNDRINALINFLSDVPKET
jgi:hypothetical protein